MIDKNELKVEARGRWGEILRSLAPALAQAIDRSPRPVHCPLPGHDDNNPSFRIDDISEGKAICSCGNYDGPGLLMQLNGWEFNEALEQAGKVIGMNGYPGAAKPVDIISQVEAAKGIPPGMLTKYGAKIDDGKFGKVARLPMYDAQLSPCSHFDMTAMDKGFCASGKPAGLMLPHDADSKPISPPAEQVVAMVEGGKDAAALYSLGFYAVGLPTNNMAAKFAELCRGCNVVIVHDLDAAGIEGAKKTAGRLLGIANSVRIARLPGEIKESSGDDVRDVLRKPSGEQLVRQAIDQAEPYTVHSPECSISNVTVEFTIDHDGKPKETPVPLAVNEIIAGIRARTDDWPRVVGDVLFFDDNGRICWITRTPALFGWLSGYIKEPIRWHKGKGCASKEETYHELTRSATRYAAVEKVPHEPRLHGHYYACEFPTCGNGEALAELVDRFNPETEIDRDLIMAAIATPFWGGGPGERPLFVFTSDDGRGVGKTTLAEMIGILAGGLMIIEPSEKSAEISKRLLTPSALSKRVALIDNVKSHRFSWADLESRITAPTINGHRMYHGDAERPNTLTWIVTLNGASLSTDIAQRAVIVKLKRPEHSATWEEDTRRLITEKGQQIIADILAFLKSERFPLKRFSRWGAWERDVLSRLPEPGEAQKVIAERQQVADVEAEESEVIEEYIAGKLKQLKYRDGESVLIPSEIMRELYRSATGDKSVTTTKVSRHLGQLCDEGKFVNLRRNTCRTHGRGFVWGCEGGLCLDLEERLRNQHFEREARLQ